MLPTVSELHASLCFVPEIGDVKYLLLIKLQLQCSTKISSHKHQHIFRTREILAAINYKATQIPVSNVMYF